MDNENIDILRSIQKDGGNVPNKHLRQLIGDGYIESEGGEHVQYEDGSWGGYRLTQKALDSINSNS